jgi:hypothetical protein
MPSVYGHLDDNELTVKPAEIKYSGRFFIVKNREMSHGYI